MYNFFKHGNNIGIRLIDKKKGIDSMTIKENERIKFEMEIVDRIYRGDNLVYVFNDPKGNVFLFETLAKYESEYEKSFKKTNKLSALVEFINEFNNKIVISSIRFLKKSTILE